MKFVEKQNRGRGGEHDAWQYDFHAGCEVEIITGWDRFYCHCKDHRCICLLGYETAQRLTFDEAKETENNS